LVPDIAAAADAVWQGRVGGHGNVWGSYREVDQFVSLPAREENGGSKVTTTLTGEDREAPDRIAHAGLEDDGSSLTTRTTYTRRPKLTADSPAYRSGGESPRPASMPCGGHAGTARLTLEEIAARIATAEGGLAAATSQYDRNVFAQIRDEYKSYAAQRAKERAKQAAVASSSAS
jgi:hypothetical protein